MTADAAPTLTVHRARVDDVRGSSDWSTRTPGPILLEKTLANLFEDVTEFWVAELDGRVVGCGALHVLWEDLGEIRTVATDPARPPARGRPRGVRRRSSTQARDLGLHRLFVLTFEVEFFRSLGFEPIDELDLSPEAYAELRSSYDRGVAEFLDLPYVKPNTLGNTRMLEDPAGSAGRVRPAGCACPRSWPAPRPAAPRRPRRCAVPSRTPGATCTARPVARAAARSRSWPAGSPQLGQSQVSGISASIANASVVTCPLAQ